MSNDTLDTDEPAAKAAVATHLRRVADALERGDPIPTDPPSNASKATFEVFKDAASEWRWRLVHDNGNVIADSAEGYASKQRARSGLESVRTNAPAASVAVITE